MSYKNIEMPYRDIKMPSLEQIPNIIMSYYDTMMSYYGTIMLYPKHKNVISLHYCHNSYVKLPFPDITMLYYHINVTDCHIILPYPSIMMLYCANKLPYSDIIILTL